MRYSPVLIALVLVFATLGTGLVGADVTDAASPFAAGDTVPRSVPGPGLFGGFPVTGSAPGESLPAKSTPGDRASAVTDGPTSPDGTHSVRVGVVGSAFADSSTLDDRVAARYRTGRSGIRLVPGDHDTAVASVVAERSEDAVLYLASVGYEPTPEEYARAVEWLVAHDVDVIVDAGSYYPQTAGGRQRITQTTERAAAAGTVFVTSSGNTANRHWRGDVGDSGWVGFDDNVEGNRLGEGAISGTVTLRLYWQGDADYDLYLYRDTPGEDQVVAKSTREQGSVEAIDAVLPEGRYYVAVYTREPGSSAVDLVAARHRLQFANANGSVVAASTTTAGVISVGALGPDGRLAAYSPSDADVQAEGTVQLPDGTSLRGTSAAAPAVASVVAEMTAEAGTEGLTPAEIEQLLRMTADDGRIDRDAAVAAAAARAGWASTTSNTTEDDQPVFPGP